MNNKTRKGGKVVAAGGYGCVFRPAIKCKGTNIKTKGVSKLLIKKYADNEYNEIQKYLPILSTIQNNKDYFIITGITRCEPDNLTKEDKINLDTKCSNLTNHGINSNNINNSLNKLGLLNLPDGGINLNTYIKQPNLTIKDLITLNNNLILLLKNGLEPMNKKNLFHTDLKAENILFGKDNKCRIIDWGLSCIQLNNEIPNIVLSRPFQFNNPFSSSLFYKIQNVLNEENITNGFNKQNLNDISIFIATKYVYKVCQTSSHFQYMFDLYNTIFYELQISTSISKSEMQILMKYTHYYNIIIDYIKKVIDTYTDIIQNNKLFFNSTLFFNEIYKHNVDVWGFITFYLNILIEIIEVPNKFNIPNNNKIKFKLHLINIITKYIFSSEYAVKKINIDILINELEYLNLIINPTNSLAPALAPALAQQSIKTIQQATSNEISLHGRLRCPKGYKINPKTKKCKKNIKK